MKLARVWRILLEFVELFAGSKPTKYSRHQTTCLILPLSANNCELALSVTWARRRDRYVRQRWKPMERLTLQRIFQNLINNILRRTTNASALNSVETRSIKIWSSTQDQICGLNHLRTASQHLGYCVLHFSRRARADLSTYGFAPRKSICIQGHTPEKSKSDVQINYLQISSNITIPSINLTCSSRKRKISQELP